MGQKCRLAPGDVVNGTYKVVQLLGSGYSGEVWEVEHLFVPASLAIKLMHEEDLGNEHKTSRLNAEARALFQLQHENVVRVVDANQTAGGLFFIVMELLRGETLAKRMAKGRLHPLRALKYAYEIACGLDAAHEILVIHRDVKPENIFVTLDDVAKVLDFTAGQFLGANLRTTKPPDRVGTLAYMAPEYIHGASCDASIDQYSLAVMAWCMLAGRHPYEKHLRNQYGLIRAQCDDIPEPLAKVAGLPAWIDALFAPALAKEAARRYPTMAHFARAIHEGVRRLHKEVQDGDVTIAQPLGEPPIDLHEDGGGARTGRRAYAAPQAPVHQTTEPVLPSQRITLAPGTLGGTAPLPVSAPRTTTAPVHQAAATERIQRRPRFRAWVAPLAVALAIVAALGFLWRGKTAPHQPEIAAQAASATSEPAPLPPASATAEPAAAAAPASLPRAPEPAAGSVPVKAPARPKPKAEVTAPPSREPPAQATAPPSIQASAPPAPSRPSHRVFGSED